MHIIKHAFNFVNDGPSAEWSAAAGGLTDRRGNRTILSFATGRTAGALAAVGLIRQTGAGVVPAPALQTVRNTWRAARAYKDFIALTFLGSVYAHATFAMDGAV
jgi:hypothetical protein